MFAHGGLADNVYLSILPVKQGVEQSAGAGFAPIPITSTVKIVTLDSEGGCNAVALRFGVLGMAVRKYPHIPFIINQRIADLQNKFEQIQLGTPKDALETGEAAIGQPSTLVRSRVRTAQENWGFRAKTDERQNELLKIFRQPRRTILRFVATACGLLPSKEPL